MENRILFVSSLCFYVYWFVSVCFNYFVIFNTFVFFWKDKFNRPCKDTSPQCLKESLQLVLPEFVNGIPEMGLTSLDPLMVTNLTFSLPGDIRINIRQGYTKGLRKCIVDVVRYF